MSDSLIGDYIHAHVQNYLYYGLDPTPVKGSGYGEKESGAYVNYNFENIAKK